MSKVHLPAVTNSTAPILASVAIALGIPRDALAADDDIEHAYTGLPRILSRIPQEKRSHLWARLCVAVVAGLFDSAINYAWNAAVVELRDKIRLYGLNIVTQTLGYSFDDKKLFDLKDAELLQLCLKLNLVSEEGFFYLDQCREMRNNFSAAHPAIGTLDDHEVLQFASRCVKHAIVTDQNPKGVDTPALLKALKQRRFAKAQADKWVEILLNTHEAQRELLLGMLHGIYCDPASSQETRLNCLDLMKALKDEVTPRVRSELLDRHNTYVASGDDKRQTSSQALFSALGFLSLLTEAERHSIITRAAQRLLSAHQEFNNFYNEPPFAERLNELAQQSAIPDSAQFEFVCVVTLCATGNQYGVSWAAHSDYEAMIRNFGPTQVVIMLQATDNYPPLASRLKHYLKCQDRFRDVVAMIEPASVPVAVKGTYAKWGPASKG